MNARQIPAEPREFALLNDYQQRFPLCPAPFAAIGETHGLDTEAVIARYRRWLQGGVVSRIGPVFAPKRVGASTLAAMAVPEERLEAVARQISAYPAVNHNYEREHAWNLWFVVTSPDAAALEATLAQMREETGCPLIALPLETPYHIDLGFDLAGGEKASQTARAPDATAAIPPPDTASLQALQGGLPLVSRPYAALGEQLGIDEASMIQRIENWLDAGYIKRFGVVVRHHELGYQANVMCVWAVPPGEIDRLGEALAREAGVTLCYRRRPDAEHWPYNLYCMIHGQDHAPVIARRQEIAGRLGLDQYPHAMLFSRRRFKQCGAQYGATAPEAVLG